MAFIDSATEAAVRDFLRRAAQVYAIEGAYLFGSRARQQRREDSDADVALVLREPAGGYVETKLALVDVAYDVLLATGIRIEPLPIGADEWARPEDSENPRLLHNIRREGIAL